MAYTILCDEGVTFTASELLSPHFLKVKEHDFAGAIARVSGDVYMVTMSPAFSDAYAAACLARDAVREKNPERNMFVIDTRTAFAGELAVARRLHDLLLAGKQPERCVITYSGCPERAKELGKKLKKLCGFRELVIIPADQAAVRYMGSGTMMAAF